MINWAYQVYKISNFQWLSCGLTEEKNANRKLGGITEHIDIVLIMLVFFVQNILYNTVFR